MITLKLRRKHAAFLLGAVMALEYREQEKDEKRNGGLVPSDISRAMTKIRNDLAAQVIKDDQAKQRKRRGNSKPAG